VADETREGVVAEAGTALEAFLESYLVRGEVPPPPVALAALGRAPGDYATGFAVAQAA